MWGGGGTSGRLKGSACVSSRVRCLSAVQFHRRLHPSWSAGLSWEANAAVLESVDSAGRTPPPDVCVCVCVTQEDRDKGISCFFLSIRVSVYL